MPKADARRSLAQLASRPWAKCTFLSVFPWAAGEAKGVAELLQAYAQEFQCCSMQPCPDVALVVKTDAAPGAGFDLQDPAAVLRNDLQGRMARHVKGGCQAPRVEVVAGALPPMQMVALYRAVDAYVLASHGEEWGRTYLEVLHPRRAHCSGCGGREGTSEAGPEAGRQAVGGGCQSGWGRLLSVKNAIETGTWCQGDCGWA